MCLKRLKKWRGEQDFNPGLLGLFVNPFYFARKGLYDAVASMNGYMKGRMLDVGCGQKPYRHLFDGVEYCGLEIAGRDAEIRKEADFYYDGDVFPFADNSFDAVFSSEVLEHVFAPEGFLQEIRRVLRPGGYFLVTVPFIWDEHELPHDYARYSSFGLAHLLEKNGFGIVEQRKTMTGVRAIFQMWNLYVHKKASCRFKAINFLVILLMVAPVNVLGQVLSWVLPVDEGLYLNNVFLVQKNW